MLDSRPIQSVVGLEKGGRRIRGNQEYFASVATRVWKMRSGRCRGNPRRPNKRGCALMKSRGARSWRFHNVRSPRLPGSTSSSRRNPLQCRRSSEVHHASGAEKILCLPRKSGNKRKYAQVAARSFSQALLAIVLAFVRDAKKYNG